MTDGVSLRDHVEARFAELEKRLDERDLRYAQRFEAQQEALGEVKESYNADKKQANEWRGALDDTQSHHASGTGVRIRPTGRPGRGAPFRCGTGCPVGPPKGVHDQG